MKKFNIWIALLTGAMLASLPISAQAATTDVCSSIPAPSVYFTGSDSQNIPTATTISASASFTNSAVSILKISAVVNGVTLGSSYSIQQADAGKSIYFVQTSKCNGFISTQKTGSYKVSNVRIFNNPQSPTIGFTDGLGSSSNHQQGTGIVLYRGTWNPIPQKISYQWYRNGIAISGATTGTYLLSPSDRNAYLKVTMTLETPGYTPFIYTSQNIQILGSIISK